ncbi:MAG: hypothetical protein FD169_1905 [Bacillota bacterium]|nr:MAG: hypothetical protein FD169_1905 [Bacillota bacterium]MBS3950988.1 hypothetical protein [Peptococcaceae bacterium]
MWAVLVVLYVLALLWSLYKLSLHPEESQVICLDFGDATDLVEPTLRQLAREVERYSIYDLSVYLQANEEEARSIALRLSGQVPMNLYIGSHPEYDVINIGESTRRENTNITSEKVPS